MTTTRPDLATLLTQLVQAALTEQQQPQPLARPEPPMPNRVLLTVEEAAQQLGIGRSLAFRLIRDGELESVQIGRLRRVPTSAITDYATRLITRQAPTTTRAA